MKAEIIDRVTMSDQGIAALTYERPKNSATTPTTLETEYKVSFNANTGTIEWFMTLDPAVVPEVTEVTIAAGTVGNSYVIDVEANGTTKSYIHKQVTGDTGATIAAFLAKIIDSDSNVSAKAVANVITITAAIPGTDLIVDGSDSTAPADVTVAVTTASSGTPMHRKIGEASVSFTVLSNGFPEIALTGKWFDGAAVPVQLGSTFGPLRATSNKTLDAIQTAQGVARPV